jgi:hypothetical protein
MKYIIICLLTALYSSSCTKEKTTAYYAYIENKTLHKVVIRPFSGGRATTAKEITILANNKVEIANGSERGFSNGGFISSNFSGADSIVVIFDDAYSITHYGATPAVLNRKHYLFSNPRNIGNWRNYQLMTNNISKYKRENIHVFDIVEQDYSDTR